MILKIKLKFIGPPPQAKISAPSQISNPPPLPVIAEVNENETHHGDDNLNLSTKMEVQEQNHNQDFQDSAEEREDDMFGNYLDDPNYENPFQNQELEAEGGLGLDEEMHDEEMEGGEGDDWEGGGGDWDDKEEGEDNDWAENENGEGGNWAEGEGEGNEEWWGGDLGRFR